MILKTGKNNNISSNIHYTHNKKKHEFVSTCYLHFTSCAIIRFLFTEFSCYSPQNAFCAFNIV